MWGEELFNNPDKSTLSVKACNLVEFLVRAYCLERPVREIEKYEIVRWERDLPEGEGCRLFSEEAPEGAWLTVKKQRIPDPPNPPPEVSGWLKGTWKDPFKPPEVEQVMIEFAGKNSLFELLKTDEQSNENISIEMFDNNPQRVRRWQKWLKEEWEPWAREAAPKKKVQELYNQLFLLKQRLDLEQENLELVWGHGMFYLRLGEERIRHPVLTTRLTVEFDEKAGVITIAPATTILGRVPTVPETWFLEGLNLPIADREKFAALRGEFVDPWDLKRTAAFYERFVNLISPEGKVLFDRNNLKPEERPCIAHEPVIFIRPKRPGYRRDLETILDALRKGHEVPPPVAGIVTDESPVAGAGPESDREEGEELLFPLPANKEQGEIAARLARHTGVTVQGPPGTGKSHTIVNLTCHLLAQGKRVLITAKAERPLRVLREMFPEELRPLCVTVLADDSGSLGFLEEAVRVMSEKVTTLDKGEAEKGIKLLRQNLRDVREGIASLRKKIRDVARRENKSYNLSGREYTPGELARWVRENESRLGWIPDDLPEGAALPLTLREIARFYELAGLLDREECVQAGQILPDPGLLPPGKELRVLVGEIHRLQKQLAGSREILSGWEPPGQLEINVVERVREEAMRAEAGAREYFREEWLQAVFQDVLSGGARSEIWEKFTSWLEEVRDTLISLSQVVSEHRIELPLRPHIALLKSELEELEAYLARGKKVGMLAKILKPRFKYLIENCLVDGMKIASAEEVGLVLKEVERRQLVEKLLTRWQNEIVAVGGPELAAKGPRLPAKIDEYVRIIKNVFDWKEKLWAPLAEEIQRLGLAVPCTVTPDTVREIADRLAFIGKKLKLDHLNTKIEGVCRYLKDSGAQPGASGLWNELSESLEAGDWDRWDGTIRRIRYLHDVRKLEAEQQSLKSRLAEVAPKWAETVVLQGGKGSPLKPPENVAEAWEWRKAETYLKKMHAEDPRELSRRLDELLQREGKLVAELVALSTWLTLAGRVTEEQRRSLVAWKDYVRRIGKGTGKYAGRYRALAQREMEKARAAVPVWVMPLNRVVESFHPLNEPFDVVIIDESSQMDALGILALFRAKKVVIVGDDKQISPYGVGRDLAHIHRMIEQYLQGIPHKELFDPQFSLYDLAGLIFPGVILLREHFRCLPEIIQFSNEVMYEGKILPLREKDPRLGENWQPVIARRVEKGFRTPGRDVNEPEAEALVDQVIACCEDPVYDGMTMGVISLLGTAQARLINELLLEKLGPGEMHLRRILCGDAYFFQGDQRDVMFLSLVEAAGGQRPAVLNKMNDLRRFNVAASRARNQMWLFYSIDPEEFHAEDVRARLIRYCLNPALAGGKLPDDLEELLKLCESPFEQEVLKDLWNRGYSVTPQYKVGHYRIDLVVFGANNKKLAVECDGDKYHYSPEKKEEDLNRQMILERLGWKFYRIRGSQYFRRPRETIAELVDFLEDMGIRPLNCSR